MADFSNILPDFNRSQLVPINYKPWRWTTLPDAQGNGGVKQELNGFFILINEDIFNFISNKLSAAEKTLLASWVNRMDINDADILKRPQTWNVPLWAGQNTGIYIRIPATEMATPQSPVTARIARFFDKFYN